MLPERVVGKECGVPWQAAFEMRAELRLHFGTLADEIASMSGEELQVSGTEREKRASFDRQDGASSGGLCSSYSSGIHF